MNNKSDSEKNIVTNWDIPLMILFRTGISTEYFKIITIVSLLAASFILYKTEPKRTIDQVYLTSSTINDSKDNNINDIDDNPYGFHLFYQVHRRIQYQNPIVNPCYNIDPTSTILFAILSRASNVHIREAIRHTWGAIKVYNDIELRISFIVAVDDSMIKQIEIEQNVYHGKIDFFKAFLPKWFDFTKKLLSLIDFQVYVFQIDTLINYFFLCMK